MDSKLQQWVEQVRAAAAESRPLRLRGGGSKDGYGQSLQGEIFDTRGYSGIISYEPSELVVTVRAGTRLAELEATLAQQGQCLPFEPPHRMPAGVEGEGSSGAASAKAGLPSTATCGGMVAAGLSGPGRASAGAVRDFILGVRIVNGRGELLSFGGQVMKNVAGYDVSRLLAGSMGTLGLIAEISLKVLPQPPSEATLTFALRQHEALQCLHRWGGQPLPLNASCWAATSPSNDSPDPPGLLSLRLCGAVAAVDAACRQLHTEMGGERLDTTSARAFWLARRDLTMPWPRVGAGVATDADMAVDLWRLSVPQTAPVLDLPGVPMIEWHGGQRWLSAVPADAGRVRAAARAAGGSATLFVPAVSATTAQADIVGIDTARTGARAFLDPLTPPLARIHQNLKREFDPAGIFNRGRLYADW